MFILESSLRSELVRRLFEAQGWQVTELSSSKAPLVKVKQGMPWGCGDGRRTQVGPSVLGATYFRAMYKTGGNFEGLRKASADIRNAGFTPTVHGTENDPLDCGMRSLWIQGIVGKYPYKLNAEDINMLVRLGELELESYSGTHAETDFYVNLVKGKTIAPSTNFFRTDLWAAPIAGVSVEQLIKESVLAIGHLSHGKLHQATIIKP